MAKRSGAVAVTRVARAKKAGAKGAEAKKPATAEAKKPATRKGPAPRRSRAKAAVEPVSARAVTHVRRSRGGASATPAAKAASKSGRGKAVVASRARPAGATARAGTRGRRARPTGWRSAYAEMQRSARGLESSIGDVRDGLRHAERTIRDQARDRILGLRREVEDQVKGLRERQREAVGKIDRVRGAAGESWVEIRSSFDAIVADARATAASVVARLRHALLS